MKKLSFFLYFLLFAGLFLYLPSRTYASCLNFTGTFTADNWPDPNAKAHIWCDGDIVPGPSMCTGSHDGYYSPGEQFDLNECSCLVDPTGKCIQVDSLPQGCYVASDLACGENGLQPVSADRHIICQPPPTSTPVPVINLRDLGGSCSGPTPVVNLSWDESPAFGGTQSYEIFYCTSGCDNISPFVSVGTSNTNSWHGNVSLQNTTYSWFVINRTHNTTSGKIETTTKTCTTTTLTPPVTLPPTPTNTPTPTIPAATSTPVPTATPAPTPTTVPIPTSTSGFSADMCKCDGLDATPIFPGANVSFSAFAKVFGTDASLAIVKDITFKVFESLQSTPNEGTIIGQSSPISSQVISQDSSAVRYKSTWNYTFPSNVNTSSLYRVIGQINCVKKIAMAPAPQTVLGAESQPGFLQVIYSAAGRLFDLITGGIFGGGGSGQSTSAPAQAPVPTQTTSQRNTLQLKTLQPAKMLEKSCSLIKFQFNNQ